MGGPGVGRAAPGRESRVDVASLRIPLEVQPDRKNYVRGSGRVVFAGIQVEFL